MVAAETLQAPRAAVRSGVPFETYCEIEAIHATALKDLLVSPHLYRYRREQPRPDSDTFRQGKAGHTAILEPDRFLLEYALWPAKRGRRYGKAWDAFRAANEGRTILTEEQYQNALAMRDAARRHPVLGPALARGGRTELTIDWVHQRSGLRCKSRLDWCADVLADLKGTWDPSPRAFHAQAVRRFYPMQLAFYRDALRAAGEDLPVEIWAVQSREPFDVAVYRMPDDALAFGASQYEAAIDRLVECHARGDWPGVAPERITFKLPAWATAERDNALLAALAMNGEALFDT